MPIKFNDQIKTAGAVNPDVKASQSGRIEGYASTFGGAPDRHGEIVLAGAFADTLTRHRKTGETPVMLWAHAQEQPIGKWHGIEEDSTGLFVEGTLNLNTTKGREAFEHIKAGDAGGLSIGFTTPEDGRQYAGEGVFHLSKVDVLEVSVVAIPARALVAAGKHLQTKDGADPFELLTKKFGDLTDETLKRIGGTDAKINELAENVSSMEQQLARAGSFCAPAEKKSWGGDFIEQKGADIRALSQENQGRVSLNVKATLTTGLDSGGAIDNPTRDVTVGMPRQRLLVRDLLNVISISTGTVEYASQTTRASNAATVAEGAAKPESEIDWELKTASSKVIAHWIKASRQILEDAPQIRDLINSDLIYGLALAEEQQLLSGDGTGSNLTGLIPSATAYSDPIPSLSTVDMIDQMGKAVLQSALADFPATGIVVHPADWWRMRLLKDADGNYRLGDPQVMARPSLFGLPVVATKSMPVDKFLVGDFASAATLYDRWQPRVEVGYVNDDFTKNLVTILAEERLALAVKQNATLTYGDFGNVT